MQKGVLLPVLYLGPISYFSQLKQHQAGRIELERFEHFPKQTYRNRMSIYSPNGKLDLTIPVKKGSKQHTPLRDVRISYEADWQRLHWRSIQTCYRNSSFFEYYEDDFAPLYETKTEFLIDHNIALTDLCLRILKLQPTFLFSESYQTVPVDLDDLRDSFSPKSAKTPTQLPYFQVFEDKHGFIPNLSIVDLIFNQGPQSKHYL